MLKILNFFKTNTGETKLVTMRQRFEAAQIEINDVLSELPEMPKIVIDSSNKTFEIFAPDQFADEALALPAPTPDTGDVVETADATPDETDDMKAQDSENTDKN